MSGLLSGSRLRSGGSGEFLQVSNAQPQLPDSVSTTTGFTLITNRFLQTRYSSSLGNIEFDQSRMYSNQTTGTITILSTGTTSLSTSTATGTLVVNGGVGIGKNLWVKDDIHVNDIIFGRGYEGKNNIVITGLAQQVVTPDRGQENLVFGYNTLKNIDTAYKTISIGSNVFSTGTKIFESIAIGHNAMRELGTIHSIVVGNITDATQTNPAVILVANHNLSTGSFVTIDGILGMTELNGNEYYVDAIDTNRLSLYSDILLSTTVDGTGYTLYGGASGILSRIVSSNDNISIGNDTAPKFVDGGSNFILGNRSARDITTGSNNFFIGNEVGNNLTNVSGIISIGAETIVDKIDNQIGIGSVFYYNGTGTSEIYSTLSVGLGEDATSRYTGALQVIGGIGTDGSVYSNEGQASENYLLYTPRVTVSTVTPTDPRIGDFWINQNTYAYLQYIVDGPTRIWLQVSSI
jgi:hypothetical protein